MKRLLRTLIAIVSEILYEIRLRRRPVFGYSVGRPVLKEKRMLDLNCTNEEKILVTLNPVTSTGRPATLDGPVTVTPEVGNGTVEMLTGLTFYVVSPDDPGDTTYVVSGDADLGSGVVTVQDTITLHAAGAHAAALGLSADAPVPK